MNQTKTMNLTDFKHIRFLGAEGIGMRALIAILEDKIKQGELSSEFRISKSDLSYKANDPLDESIDLAVRSTAVKADDPDMLFMQEHNIPVIHRSDMLNLLSEEALQIVISGTHGKTSTSALTAYLLNQIRPSSGFAVGGVLKDFPANGKAAFPESYFVMEGDESDKSFMKTNPHIAVVTDVEADHLENYPGGLNEIQDCFRKFLDSAEYKIVCTNNSFLKAYADEHRNKKAAQLKVLSYSSIHQDADIFVDLEKTEITFKMISFKLDLKISGKFNLLNASASLLVALIILLKENLFSSNPSSDSVTASEHLSTLIPLLRDFQGTERRMELINKDLGIYDDYAHHPSEIRALLESVKTMINSEEKALFIYQPHHPERTQQFWADFVQVFKEFPLNIDVLLLDIYVARSQHIEGVNTRRMVAEIALENVSYLDPNENLLAAEAKAADVQGNFKDIVETLKPLIDRHLEAGDYKKVFFVGAGNISKIAGKYRG
ncbi:MAG: Mur ligase family protein [bacterium]